jgi:flavin reductase (DIM6/NTAB) family NADH-FMN oxidoreductase RutF
MTEIDTAAINAVTRRLWGPVVAVSAAAAGRASAQIAVTAIAASILPERPRLLIQLWKANLTHDLVRASGAFAVHLLAEGQLDLVTRLGHHSGHQQDKLAGLPWRRGLTGSPLLDECPSYLECRLIATLDGGDMSVFLGEVVGGANAVTSPLMTMEWLRAHAGAGWHAEETARLAAARAAARTLLPGGAGGDR